MKPRLIIENGEKFDLVYSPDDGGYYFQRWSDDATSDRIFDSQETAIAAMKAGRIAWGGFTP
jgi:hypothetical protein